MTDRDKEIIRLYTEEKKSLTETGTLVGLAFSTIYDILKKHNVDRRPKTETNRKTLINQHFFDKIDTQEKAYILGLLYADGCVVEKDYEIKISLQEQDKNLLEKIKDCIEYSGQLRSIVRPPYLNQWGLDFRSKHLYNAVTNLGCVPRKSLILKFPTEEQVPKYLHSHFIRGYFDGDGCISFRSNRYNSCTVSFVGTYEMMIGIYNTFIGLGITPKKFYRSLKSQAENKNTYSFSTERKEDIRKILQFMYNDAFLYLERKYVKYKMFQNNQ